MGVLDKFLDIMKLSDDDDYEDDDFFDDDDYDDDYEEKKPKRSLFGGRKKSYEDDEDDFDELPARSSRTSHSSSNKVTPMRQPARRSGANMEVCVIKPNSVDDAREITETLLGGRTVILNLEGLDLEMRFDMETGVYYLRSDALNEAAQTGVQDVWYRMDLSAILDMGGMMEQVHQVVLSHLDFDGQGQLLDVGCGSGALSIRAALIWRAAQVVGIDYWGSAYGYGQAMCEKNAESEGVAARCRFQHGDANRLDFPDESFDAVVSNYVYHNITGADKRALLRETLRVLKKGGVFALNDEMKPHMYGDMEAFAQELRDMGYEDVRLIDTAQEAFGSRRRAAMMMLGDSRMLVGRK